MWQCDSSLLQGLQEAWKRWEMACPYHTLSTVNGMALVHTWHFERDGDAPRKNRQDGWLSLHSTAEPFCLAESIPKAH